MKLQVAAALMALLMLGAGQADAAEKEKEKAAWRFDFGGTAAPGSMQVKADGLFNAETGFGFEPGAVVKGVTATGMDSYRDGGVTSEDPFAFSVAVPEGVYRVTLLLGDAREASLCTVKAESRRLMLERVETAKGKFETRSFNVAVKRPELPSGGRVALKPPELDGHRDWDTKLTLEFSNARPSLCALEIVPAKDYTTVYIAGDSTVTNQRSEPWAGWGQMLPRFFNDSVVVTNHAHSGLALSSFKGGRRLEKILSGMKKGDYLFIQFGHNDQKSKAPGAGPYTTYKEDLKRFIQAARSKEGIPVLVTPMERRRFEKDGQLTATLKDYAEAVRQTGAEEKVPVIDLNAMSLQFYAALGEAESMKAFAFYPANSFPGQTEALRDNTHHSVYGGYELARCVVEGIKAHLPALATSLAGDAGTFDPAHPDAPEKIDIPVSAPIGLAEVPEGS